MALVTHQSSTQGEDAADDRRYQRQSQRCRDELGEARINIGELEISSNAKAVPEVDQGVREHRSRNAHNGSDGVSGPLGFSADAAMRPAVSGVSEMRNRLR